MELSDRELTIVLAGLRLLERDPGFAREFLVGTEDETVPTAAEMDTLCERVNLGDAETDGDPRRCYSTTCSKKDIAHLLGECHEEDDAPTKKASK